MTLVGAQLERIRNAMHRGADQASDALQRWIDRPAQITVDGLEQLPLDAATGVLGAPEEPICVCMSAMSGSLTGHLLLVFDDESGLSLADVLLGRERGTADTWGELEISAAMETANIVFCAYLNALLVALPPVAGAPGELLPSPPQFARDFAESVLQFALMDQMTVHDEVLLARTTFRCDGTPVDWTLLLVPDAASMSTLGAS